MVHDGSLGLTSQQQPVPIRVLRRPCSRYNPNDPMAMAHQSHGYDVHNTQDQYRSFQKPVTMFHS